MTYEEFVNLFEQASGSWLLSGQTVDKSSPEREELIKLCSENFEHYKRYSRELSGSYKVAKDAISAGGY